MNEGHAAPAHAPTLLSLNLRYQVLATESLGGLDVAWVCVAPTARTVRDARRGGSELSVEETGVVALARVRNDSFGPVLVGADLVLRGGYQTRVVERSAIVPPRSVMEVPVRCVEQGRWRPEDSQPSRLRVSEATGTRTRTTFLRAKRAALRGSHGYAIDQRSVWSHVDQELTRTGVTSSSRSYGAYLDGPRRRNEAVDAGLVGRAPPSANAIAITTRAGGAWFEVFLSPDELRQALPGIVAEIDSASAPGEEHHLPAQMLVGWLWRAPLRSIEAVRGTMGTAHVITAPGLAGDVVMLGDDVVHIAATTMELA